MKIRQGFVSNSSSSSFYICGTKVDKSEFPQLLEKLTGEPYVVPVYKDKLDELYGEQDLVNKLKKLVYNTKKLSFLWSDSGYYIGRHVQDMPEDETKKSFRESIQKYYEELFGVEKEFKFGTIHQTTFD